MKYLIKDFKSFKKTTKLDNGYQQQEYIIWDKKNNIYHYWNDYNGYGLLSGNLEIDGWTTEDRKEIIRIIVRLLNDKEYLDSEDFDPIKEKYEQDDYKKLIETKEYK